MAANIRGVLLAAGYSKRFGSNKLLEALPVGALDAGMPIALASAKHLLAALPESIAVLRPRAQKLGKVLRDAGCNTVVCRNAAEGMGVSLAAGAAIAAPSYRGERGHPVGFARAFFEVLSSLGGDAGARDVLKQHPGRIVLCEVDDPGVLQDIDQPSDLSAG